jgi:hypothetical protein
MRLKKATMRYQTTQDKRLESLRALEQGTTPKGSNRTSVAQQRFPSISQVSLASQQPYKSARTSPAVPKRSLSGDERAGSRSSHTTFQTTTTHDPNRLSALHYQTESSEDAQTTRLSLSSSNDSELHSATPSLLSQSTADKRQSRDTYFSTSSVEISSVPRNRTLTIDSHVVALDDLDKVPKREEVRSQEFIDWPYRGWESRNGLAVAR